tara:strand:- start:1103 stop:3418 length:2316 start_codon:yes stop_codon:yes gene_type:complete
MENRYKSMPSMVVAEKEKTEDWCRQVLTAVTSYMGTEGGTYHSSRTKDIRNYQIYNGVLSQGDYTYITEQYGLTYPARLVNYPIITPKIDLLIGEELRRPLDMKVTTVNKDAVIRKHDHKVGLMMRQLLDEFHSDMQEQMNIDVLQEGQGMPVPEDIETYMKYNYREMVEETAQDGLEYISNRYNIKDVFKEGFRDLLVTGKEFFKINIQNGDPYVRRVDPRNIIFDDSFHSDYLDDASWVGEERWLSINEINDEYKDGLTTDDLLELDKMRNLYLGGDLNNYNSSFEWVDVAHGREARIRVVSCEWKSLRAIKFKLSDNKYDPSRPFRKMVRDTYRKRKGDRIETKWVDDVWEATMIGGKILVNARRRDNQVRSIDDPGKTPLSYVGCIKGNTTGSTSSLVDLLDNIQMLYNIVVYQIELAMARSGGKAVVYDVSQLPTNVGMDIQQVLYHLKTDGIIPINSKDEGNQMQSFNQFQQIDFTLSQSVQQLINLKVMLEEMAGQISGVSRQREGAVGQYEYVGNVQRSVVQSATITESWFYSHGECKQRVMERLCNLMKVCWAGGKKAGMILGDGAYKFLNVMPDIALQDYGVYVGDSGKDDSMKQVVQQLSQAALQSGSIDLLGVIKVLKADTMTEAEKVLEQAMSEMQKQQQQTMQEQAQAQQAAAEAEQAKFQAEAQLKQMDNEAKLQVAQISAESRLEVAKIQADVDRDIHDTKERNEMDKKAADYYIDRKNRQEEKDREDKKEGEDRARVSGSTTTSESLKKAAQKI